MYLPHTYCIEIKRNEWDVLRAKQVGNALADAAIAENDHMVTKLRRSVRLEPWADGRIVSSTHLPHEAARDSMVVSDNRYLECGVLAHGFARARCGDCGHDLPVAFSCKGRGVCPSCNSRRMVATAAHLTDHVLPDLPLRQWVLAVPKRLRYFLQRDANLQGAALRLFLRAV